MPRIALQEYADKMLLDMDTAQEWIHGNWVGFPVEETETGWVIDVPETFLTSPDFEYYPGYRISNFKYDGDKVIQPSRRESYIKTLAVPPVSLQGEKVTTFGRGVGYAMRDLREIVSWGNLEKIHHSSFLFHKSLKSIPSMWGNIETIEPFSFRGAPIEKISSWSNVKEIGDHAFEDSFLRSIPDNWGCIEKMGKQAFRDTHLTELNAPKWDEAVDIWYSRLGIRSEIFRACPIEKVHPSWLEDREYIRVVFPRTTITMRLGENDKGAYYGE